MTLKLAKLMMILFSVLVIVFYSKRSCSWINQVVKIEK